MLHIQDRNLLVQGMRDELTNHGFTALRTPAEVDAALPGEGTVLLMINSVCGCAAGSARPGVVGSLDHAARPAALYTVFAGQDREATARARELLTAFPVSSPGAALFKDGRAVYMLHRHDIEGRSPEQVAAQLQAAYDQYCTG